MENIIVQAWVQNPKFPLREGRSRPDLIKASKESVKKYADLIGAKYVFIDTSIWPDYRPTWEQYQAFDLKFDNLCLIDTDIVVTTNNNIFDYAKEDSVGFVPRFKIEDNPCPNGGVTLWSKSAADKFWDFVNFDRTVDDKWGTDQAELYRFSKEYPEWVHNLPREFNRYIPTNLSGFLHFKGYHKEKNQWWEDYVSRTNK